MTEIDVIYTHTHTHTAVNRILLNTLHSNSRLRALARFRALALGALRALQEHIPSLIKEKNASKIVLERRNMV